MTSTVSVLQNLPAFLGKSTSVPVLMLRVSPFVELATPALLIKDKYDTGFYPDLV